MPSNLPPGVSDSDIPGNRPEDMVYEQIFDALPDHIQKEINDETLLGQKLDEKLIDLVDDVMYDNLKIVDAPVILRGLEPFYRGQIDKQGPITTD